MGWLSNILRGRDIELAVFMHFRTAPLFNPRIVCSTQTHWQSNEALFDLCRPDTPSVVLCNVRVEPFLVRRTACTLVASTVARLADLLNRRRMLLPVDLFTSN